MAEECQCTICRAKRLGVDPFFLYFPEGSMEKDLVAKYPGKAVWEYEFEARNWRQYDKSMFDWPGIEEIAKTHGFPKRPVDPPIPMPRFLDETEILEQALSDDVASEKAHELLTKWQASTEAHGLDVMEVMDSVRQTLESSKPLPEPSPEQGGFNICMLLGVIGLSVAGVLVCLGAWKAAELLQLL